MVIFFLFAAIFTALLAGMSLQLQRSFARFRIRKNYTAALSAPSVSVCIPARNETHAMTDCLEALLASDYAKMEIIVFDDSSTDDTSVLVRSFAHVGVRFVPGTPLPEGWLGKNHALEVLAREASGTYIIFMDVDTRVQPTTISQLVGYTMTENVEMISVIPRRDDGWRASVLFSPLRYFWELVLSRAAAPASSSALWMLKRHTLLERFNGLAQMKAAITPEAIFARLFGTTQYHCLVANERIGVRYEKKWRSQLETSQRMLYPKIGVRGIVPAIIVLVLLNMPSFIVVSSLVFGWMWLHIASLWLLLVSMAVYAAYASRVWRRGWWLGGLLWPYIIFQELVLLLGSMSGYATRSIVWKGRSVASKVAK